MWRVWFAKLAFALHRDLQRKSGLVACTFESNLKYFFPEVLLLVQECSE